MGWGKAETLALFYACFLLSLATGVAALVLLKHTKKTDDRELYYIFALTVGNGIGCLWFRLLGDYVIWSHAIVHTAVLIGIVVGRKSLYSNFSKSFENYGLDLFAIGLYVAQYILSFHFVVFRYGKTKSSRAWRTAIHSFGGTIVYFAAVIDAVCRIHIFPAPNNNNASNDNAIARVLALFASGAFMWFMLLNPYFDWRRMSFLIRSKGSKKRPPGRGRSSTSRSSTTSRRTGSGSRSFTGPRKIT